MTGGDSRADAGPRTVAFVLVLAADVLFVFVALVVLRSPSTPALGAERPVQAT